MKRFSILGLSVAILFFAAFAPASAAQQDDVKLIASVISSEKVIGETVDNGILDLETLLAPVLDKLGPAPEGAKELVREMFREKLIAELSDLAFDSQVETLPQVFTGQELADIANFMRTSSGRAWAEKQAILMKTNGQVGVDNGKETAARLVADILKDVKDKGPAFLSELKKP